MAKKKSYTAQPNLDGDTIREEYVDQEELERKRQLKLIKDKLKDLKRRGYDVSNIDISELEKLDYQSLEEWIYANIEYVTPTGEVVSGTTGRKIERQRAREKAYFNQTGRKKFYVQPEYQSIFDLAINNFEEWLYNEVPEKTYEVVFFAGDKQEAERLLNYSINKLRAYYIELLDNYGRQAVAQLIIENQSDIQHNIDVVSYRTRYIEEVLQAFDEIVYILGGFASYQRDFIEVYDKEVDEYE